jgi:hypothetical protein
MDESLRFPRETNGQRPNRRFHRRNLGRFQGPDRRPRSPFFLRVQVEDRLYDHPDYTGSVICRPNDCVLSLTLKSSSLLINLLSSVAAHIDSTNDRRSFPAAILFYLFIHRKLPLETAGSRT